MLQRSLQPRGAVRSVNPTGKAPGDLSCPASVRQALKGAFSNFCSLRCHGLTSHYVLSVLTEELEVAQKIKTIGTCCVGICGSMWVIVGTSDL